jgi:hypothetical protein
LPQSALCLAAAGRPAGRLEALEKLLLRTIGPAEKLPLGIALLSILRFQWRRWRSSAAPPRRRRRASAASRRMLTVRSANSLLTPTEAQTLPRAASPSQDSTHSANHGLIDHVTILVNADTYTHAKSTVVALDQAPCCCRLGR